MLRIGILGAAGIAPRALILPARRRTDTVVAAIASRSGESAASYAAQHGIERWYGSYADLLADPDIDLVYNALPPSEHAPWSISALRAGKHVLCEKPFAMNARQAEQMNAVAAETGFRLIEAFHDRYHPISDRMTEIAASLGEIESARGVFDSENLFDPRSLRHDPKLGGGALMDLGCYPIHWLRTVLGADPTVVSAAAQLNPLGADIDMQATLRFPGGVTGTISANMTAGQAFDASLTIRGSRGTATVDDYVFPSRGHSIHTVIDGVESWSTVGGGETYDHQLAAVVDGLASGAELLTEGSDPVATMRVIDAVYAAAGMDRSALA